jgi:hypothetical protein
LAISTLFVVPIKEQLEELAVGCFELVVAQLEPIVEPDPSLGTALGASLIGLAAC